MSQRVGIIGIGQSAFRSRRDDASYPDLVREAVTLALNDAKLELDGVEAVVYSLSPDAMVGIGNAERLGVDAVGGRNKRFLRINTGGATGISSVAAAYYHIAAGACDVVLTAGADKVGECGDSQTVLNKIWDPTYERQLPLGTISMLAMSAVRYMDKYGMTEEDMARVVVKNRWQASKNPNAHLRKETTEAEVFRSRYICWPVKLFDCCPQSSGGGAMVLASERYSERFKGVNDLFFAANGDMYFTDQGRTGHQDPTGRVFRWTTEGRLYCLLDCAINPNGLVTNLDETVLYVAMTNANAVWHMHLMPNGDVTAVGTFIQLSGGIGPDGMALRRVNSCGSGLLTNVAFGGPDMQTLYITDAGAGTIQRVRLPVAGRPMYSHQ